MTGNPAYKLLLVKNDVAMLVRIAETTYMYMGYTSSDDIDFETSSSDTSDSGEGEEEEEVQQDMSLGLLVDSRGRREATKTGDCRI